MTLFDKNIDLRVAKVCRKKYEQLIIDDCYDKGKVYIVTDPNIDAEYLKIINLGDCEDDFDAVNFRTLKKTSGKIEQLKNAQLTAITFCGVLLDKIDNLINSIKSICSYTIIDKFDNNEIIESIKQYDPENIDSVPDLLKYIMNLYNIQYEDKKFLIDDVYFYTEKISIKLGFKIYK